MKHQLTREERSRGGKRRTYNSDGSYRSDFLEMCEKGYEALQAKNYTAWLYLSQHVIFPQMKRNGKKGKK